MTKSKIEQELLNLQGYPKGYLTQEQRLFNINSAIQNTLKDLEKKKVCESRVGLHICEKHPEDCYYMIEWSDVIEAFGEVRK